MSHELRFAGRVNFLSDLVLNNPALIAFGIVQVGNLNGNIEEQGGTVAPTRRSLLQP